MKVNIKDTDLITIDTQDNISKITNNSDVNFYIIIGERLFVAAAGSNLSTLTNNIVLITDVIDDIILYYPDALSSFQARYTKIREPEENIEDS